MATNAGPHTETVIVGAGIAGIGAGIALRKAGFHDFVILERADDAHSFRPSYSYREWWASRTLSMTHFRFGSRLSAVTPKGSS